MKLLKIGLTAFLLMVLGMAIMTPSTAKTAVLAIYQYQYKYHPYPVHPYSTVIGKDKRLGEINQDVNSIRIPTITEIFQASN